MTYLKKFNKYKLIIRPLVIVLMLDLVLLVTNYKLSIDLEASAVAINIAGRQRMLSQKITKSLAFIAMNDNSQTATKHIDELIHSAALFDQTLHAFLKGGQATNAAGKPIVLPPLTGVDTILQPSIEIWLPFYQQLLQLVGSKAINQSEYYDLLMLMQQQNLILLDLMNDLTVSLEDDAEDNTYFLRSFQTIIVSIIFILAFVSVLRFTKREKYYGALMAKTSDVVVSIDIETRRLAFVSRSIEPVLGYKLQNVLYQPITLFLTEKSTLFFQQLLDEINNTGVLSLTRTEAEIIKADGSIIHTDVLLGLINSEQGSRLELSADFRDISERKSHEQRLTALAKKDSLTGLSNRHSFVELLEHAMLRSKHLSNQLAVLFIDLDGFKAINDSFGHEAGDALLVELSARMKQTLRDSDVVARMGGDEFTVLLENIHSKKEVEHIANKLLAQLALPYFYNNQQCQVTASIGCSFYNMDNMDNIDANQLISHADKAMYGAKFNNKNAIHFYTSKNLD